MTVSDKPDLFPDYLCFGPIYQPLALFTLRRMLKRFHHEKQCALILHALKFENYYKNAGIKKNLFEGINITLYQSIHQLAMTRVGQVMRKMRCDS